MGRSRKREGERRGVRHMKRTFLALCVVVCLSALCFAQQEQQQPAPEGFLRFSGRIDSMQTDVMEGGSAEQKVLTKIVVSNPVKTKTMEFKVDDSTAIITRDGKTLRNDDRSVIEYSALEKNDVVGIQYELTEARLNQAKIITWLSE